MSFGIPASAPVPAVIPDSTAMINPNVSSSSSSVSSPLLILIAKDMSDDDLNIIKGFGSVLSWKDSFANVPFSQLVPSDYLILDVRLKSARIALGKENLKSYSIVNYVSWIQQAEDFIKQIGGNVISSIPQHAVNKQDFDQALLSPKIISPSQLKSIFQFVVGCFKK